MAQVRKRYYLWLIKAYVKRWKKMIFYSSIAGVLIFFAGFAAFSFYLRPLLENSVKRIGYVGVYEPKDLPSDIISDVSFGLTKVNANGSISPGAASSWEIQNHGKTYVFHLKKGLYFSNGEELTTQTLPLNFTDVKRQDIDDYTLSYTLKSPFSPFLVSVSHPILLSDFSGLAGYTVKNIELNGGFVKSMELDNKNDHDKKKIIYFYPTYDALKTAFALGEVNQIIGADTINFENTTLAAWKGATIHKSVSYDQLVTLFYNNNDAELSNKKLREALNYALPPTFKQGLRAFSPISPQSIYFSKGPNYGLIDEGIAKDLLSDVKLPKGSTFTLSTTQEYYDVAKTIQKAWAKVGVQVKIQVVDSIPTHFQMFLQSYLLPQDPDQYTLWHSDQPNNISQFKSLRIDQLLEDGRSTLDQNERINIYSDFQKYMLDEVPASFLYFPYRYTVIR
jgi:peptide/nickel transport system substrate-binding protein